MILKIRAMPVVMAALVAVAVTGCGGGSGGNARPAPQPLPTTVPARAEALEDSTTAANTAEVIARAAEARPRSGSVTQSSNVDSNNITTDAVEITAEYGSGGPSFSIHNGTAWSIGMGEGDPSRIAGTMPPWQGAELSKRITGGTLYVDAYSDIEAPETRQVAGGDDGTRNVPPGTMISSAGVNLSTGGNLTGIPGTLDGESGVFNCDGSGGGCGVSRGSTTRGMWTFSPDRPPGAVDVSSSDTVVLTGPSTLDRYPGTRNDQQGWFRCLSLSCGVSTSTVNGQTRATLRGDWIFVPSTTTIVTSPDGDYLAGGVWLVVPDDASSAAGYVFGAFADGSDPFLQNSLTSVQGTATFEGDATGVRSETTGGFAAIGYFDGDVTLTADFGSVSALGTISGSITNFEVDGVPKNGTLNLGTASIGSRDSGFFHGSVAGSDDERSYTGHWGGQFFGNGESDGRPGAVAGTFGGHSTDSAVNYIGAFGAYKQ